MTNTVSNSSEEAIRNFFMGVELQGQDKCIVYFSTLYKKVLNIFKDILGLLLFNHQTLRQGTIRSNYAY